MAKKDAENPGFTVTDADWGYTIRSAAKVSWTVSTLQVGAWIASTILILSAIALWVAPGTNSGPDVVYLKAGASTILVTIGILLLSYSARGTTSEFEVDRVKGEIREVVPNRSGAPTRLSSYDFRDLDNATIRNLKTGKSPETLLLSYKNGMHFVPLVNGEKAALEDLKDRIVADLNVPEAPRKTFQSRGVSKKLFGSRDSVSDAA